MNFHLQLKSATRKLTFTSNLIKGQIKKLLRDRSIGSNSLSYFLAHEKEVHRTSTRYLVFKLIKKRSTGPEKEGSIIFVVGKSPIDIMEPILL